MKTLVIAPHPDDETLGCGGTLLRRKAEGAELGWLIVTAISVEGGWNAERVSQRDAEIDAVANAIGFDRVFNLQLPTTQLDRIPMGVLVEKFGSVFRDFGPEEVLLPNRSDVHTDHRIVFDAAASCTKWFRYPSVRRVLAYETISETEFGIDPACGFNPNYFIDIGGLLDRKLEILNIYRSELGKFPFPRSIEAIKALATIRGAASGFEAAEAFTMLRERS